MPQVMPPGSLLQGGVLEFFGLPGAGKTSTARALAQTLNANGRSALFATPQDVLEYRQHLSAVEKIALELRWLHRTIAHSLIGIVYAARLHGRVSPSSCRVGWRKSAAWQYLHRFVNEHSCNVVVLEEWRTSDLWVNLVGMQNKRTDVLTVAQRLIRCPIPRLHFGYVIIDIDVETAAGRVADRGYRWRLLDRLVDPSTIMEVLRCHDNVYQALRDGVVKSGRPVITVDGRDPVSMRVAQIVRWLNRSFDPGQCEVRAGGAEWRR